MPAKNELVQDAAAMAGLIATFCRQYEINRLKPDYIEAHNNPVRALGMKNTSVGR